MKIVKFMQTCKQLVDVDRTHKPETYFVWDFGFCWLWLWQMAVKKKWQQMICFADSRWKGIRCEVLLFGVALSKKQKIGTVPHFWRSRC